MNTGTFSLADGATFQNMADLSRVRKERNSSMWLVGTPEFNNGSNICSTANLRLNM